MVHHLFAGLTGLKPKVGGFAKKRVKKRLTCVRGRDFFPFRRQAGLAAAHCSFRFAGEIYPPPLM
jgi:hypothetical protein